MEVERKVYNMHVKATFLILQRILKWREKPTALQLTWKTNIQRNNNVLVQQVESTYP